MSCQVRPDARISFFCHYVTCSYLETKMSGDMAKKKYWRSIKRSRTKGKILNVFEKFGFKTV